MSIHFIIMLCVRLSDMPLGAFNSWSETINFLFVILDNFFVKIPHTNVHPECWSVGQAVGQATHAYLWLG